MAKAHTLRSFEEIIYDDISGRCFSDTVDTEPDGFNEFSVYVYARPFQ